MKKKQQKTREDNLTLGVFKTEYEIITSSGETYIIKPLSVAKLGLFPRITSKFPECGELEQFMMVFWMGVKDVKYFITLLRDGDVELEFYNFMDSFTGDDIQSIVETTKESDEITYSGAFTIEEDSETSEKK